MGGGDEPRSDGALEVIGSVMAAIDRWLIPIGWMFGLMFFGFGMLVVFTEGGDVGLLALGIALVALSRASALARLQAALVERALRDAHPGLEVTCVTRSSAGDQDQSSPLWKLPDKGAFTADLSAALVRPAGAEHRSPPFANAIPDQLCSPLCRTFA